jgi:hypothetical protein
VSSPEFQGPHADDRAGPDQTQAQKVPRAAFAQASHRHAGGFSPLEERFLPKAAQRDYTTTWGHKTASTPDADPPLPGKEETS